MEQYKDLIRKYASQLGIELTGDFNVITVVNDLPSQFFDDDRKQRLKDAISDQDFATFSDIFVAPLNVVEDDTPKSQTEDYIIKVAQDLGISEESANELATILAGINDDGVGLRLQPDTGELAPDESYFGVSTDDIISRLATPNEIKQFQDYLIQSGVFPRGYFAGTEGQYSEKLRTAIVDVMNFIDANINLTPDVVADIRKETPVYFSSVQQDNQDLSFERNLFNYGLKEFIRIDEAEKKFEESQNAKDRARSFIPPADSELEDFTEAYFYAKLGRKPTTQELDTWSTNLAKSYSTAYAESEAALAAFDDQAYAQGLVPQDSMSNTNLDLSQFRSGRTQAGIFDENFEKAFESEIDEFEAGERKKSYQNQLLQIMFGGT